MTGCNSGITVTPDDDRYDALRQGFNQRWVATPDYIKVVRSADEVVDALNEALKEQGQEERSRITVRSGGHCYEDFVCSPDVRVIIDVSLMDKVCFDPEMDAYCVEAGATNWHIYTHLYRAYGVTLPAGSCYSVGAGGHICAGGYGLLSRQHGLTVDYLFAVEVVVVRDGHAEKVLARRDSHGDLHDLWWAHTGGGGGNFGIVTRYWFKDSTDPKHLPEPPTHVWLSAVAWPWDEIDRDSFTTLVSNYGQFFADHSAPDDPYAGLFTLFKLTHRSNGKIGLISQMDATRPDSEQMLMDFLKVITTDVPARGTPFDVRMGEHAPMLELHDRPRRLPWIQATQTLNGSGDNQRGKYKSAYMRRPFRNSEIEALWSHLTSDYNNSQALVQVDSYGCAVNARASDETATVQRDSIMKLQYQTYWTDADADATHLQWIRKLYQCVYADTGGVPTSNETTDGCYIGYPDVDLDDPRWNTSGVPSYRLYYGDNYERLQHVKRTWDPHNVFRHAQSISP